MAMGTPQAARSTDARLNLSTAAVEAAALNLKS